LPRHEIEPAGHQTGIVAPGAIFPHEGLNDGCERARFGGRGEPRSDYCDEAGCFKSIH